MKTTEKIMNVARTLDRAVPDATSENVKDEVAKIGKYVEGTALSALATGMYFTAATTETCKLVMMVGKTGGKMAVHAITDSYKSAPTMVAVTR